MRAELAELRREGETLVQPLRKLTATGNTYSRAGTTELNPYLSTAKNIQQKTRIYITVFIRYFFFLYWEENGIANRFSRGAS
jgi:hypothetical protein